MSAHGRVGVRHCDIATARQGVARVHRHLKVAPRSAYVAFELIDATGWPHAWAMVGRPGAPALQALGWVEVTRVASDGTPNACSALYGAAARWAWREGRPLITYTLVTESGTSLRAAGWVELGRTATRPSGRAWSRPNRPRAPGPTDNVGKIRWIPGALFRAVVAACAAPFRLVP